MKKMTAILCILLLTCLTFAASAEVPVSNLYKPNPSETFKALVGGKSFEAGITHIESIGEDEDTKFTITMTVYERDRFDAAVIENLAEHDILCFGNGTTVMAMEVIRDEFGMTVKDGSDNGYSFFKAEDGNAYIAATDTDNPFYTEVFTIKVPLEKDITFLDGSDPENLDEPVKLGFNELLDHLLEGTDFAPYNTRVTFDENGKLIELLYSYSPWN
ncbi:MAG: hypothetical protein IJR97_13055 [Clostridia bacterium]|nr:hypothetical protein [Clostridia bacterium]